MAENKYQEYTKAKDAAAAHTKKLNGEVNNVLDGLSKLTAIGSQSSASVGGMTNSIDEMAAALKTIPAIGKSVSGTLGLVSSSISGVDSSLSGFFGLMGDSMSLMETVIEATAGGLKTLGNVFDAPSRDIRKFDQEVFSLGKRFGGTLKDSQDFADSMKTSTSSEFAKSLYITRNELAEYARATARTNISQKQLNETIETSYGQTNLLSVATAFGSSANLSATESMDLLNTVIQKQGVSAKEAAKMFGVYAGASKETGLSIDTVASGLNSAVSGFSKLGVSADFGKPILESFGNVMKDMGLGMENSVGLTNNLSSSLVGLAENYASAYVMFQRGGLDVGSGGALGASISLQADLLSAETTGDQADIASKLVGAMKETIESFGGGDIVTVSEANESPELQSQFYVQQQLLKNQFGLVDDASATRTLELLSQLDEATRSGNTDAKESLESQIAEERTGRDALLDETEKVNRHLSMHSNLLAVIAREPLMALKRLGGDLRETQLEPIIDAGGEATGKALESTMPLALALIASLGPAAGSGMFTQEYTDKVKKREDELQVESWLEMLNEADRNTPFIDESVEDLIKIVATQTANGDPAKAAGFEEYFKDMVVKTDVNITVDIDPSGKLQAYVDSQNSVNEQVTAN